MEYAYASLRYWEFVPHISKRIVDIKTITYLALLNFVPSFNVVLNNIKDNWSTKGHVNL